MAGGTFREILSHTGESHTALSLETRVQADGRRERVKTRRGKQAEAGGRGVSAHSGKGALEWERGRDVLSVGETGDTGTQGLCVSICKGSFRE